MLSVICPYYVRCYNIYNPFYLCFFVDKNKYDLTLFPFGKLIIICPIYSSSAIKITNKNNMGNRGLITTSFFITYTRFNELPFRNCNVI